MLTLLRRSLLRTPYHVFPHLHHPTSPPIRRPQSLALDSPCIPVPGPRKRRGNLLASSLSQAVENRLAMETLRKIEPLSATRDWFTLFKQRPSLSLESFVASLIDLARQLYPYGQRERYTTRYMATRL